MRLIDKEHIKDEGWHIITAVHLDEDTEIEVSDPCYTEGIWCSVKAVMPAGDYDLLARIEAKGEWGRRVMALRMIREGAIADFERTAEAGVDSGMCGIYWAPRGAADEAEVSSWWPKFCDDTRIGDDDWANVMETDCGVVTSSGYGDGCYPVYIGDGFIEVEFE